MSRFDWKGLISLLLILGFIGGFTLFEYQRSKNPEFRIYREECWDYHEDSCNCYYEVCDISCNKWKCGEYFVEVVDEV